MQLCFIMICLFLTKVNMIFFVIWHLNFTLDFPFGHIWGIRTSFAQPTPNAPHFSASMHDFGHILGIRPAFAQATPKITAPQTKKPTGQSPVGLSQITNYLCTRPDASPPAKVSTSLRVTKLKSPGIVCFNADAATPNSRAALKSLPSNKPQIVPPAKESPPPTRSTIG